MRLAHGATGESVSGRGRRMRIFALLTVVPVVGTLLFAALLAARAGEGREAACWVLPNARVLLAPGDGDCGLRTNEQIRKIESGGRGVVSVGDAEVVRGRFGLMHRAEGKPAGDGLSLQTTGALRNQFAALLGS